MSPRIHRGTLLFLPIGWLSVLLVAISISMAGKAVAHRKPASAEGMRMLFRIQEQKVEFTYFAESRLMVTRACQKADGTLACAAYEAYQRAGNFTSNSGERDPAAQARNLCKMTGGRIEAGNDEHSNEASFCRYDDGSMLDLPSLFGAVGRR